VLVSDSKMKIFSKGALAAIFWGGFRPVLIRPMFYGSDQLFSSELVAFGNLYLMQTIRSAACYFAASADLFHEERDEDEKRVEDPNTHCGCLVA